VKRKPIPFDFVLENLDPLSPVVRPMFGCYAVYIGEKMMIMLRLKESEPNDNGIWVATSAAHHGSLKKDFPSLRPIQLFGNKESAWQVLPVDADDFEEMAGKVCELILRNDPRIGKIPKTKTVKAKKKR
jgi:hypothetical protein